MKYVICVVTFGVAMFVTQHYGQTWELNAVAASCTVIGFVGGYVGGWTDEG